jgi:hypothetical protein
MTTTLKIRRLLDEAVKLNFTKHDFADLAIVAAKRSGVTATEQIRVASILGIEAEEQDCGTKADHVRALTRLCVQLGGRLAIVSRQTISDLLNRDWPDYDGHDSFEEAEAGFDLEHHEGFSGPGDSDVHGLEWRKKIIYVVRGRVSVGHVIHEMGHVFADRHPPDNSKCCEWNWFGWEMAVARQIGAWATWSRHNADYYIGKGDQWGGLSARRRQTVIANRIRRAKKIGIITTSEEPRSIR